MAVKRARSATSFTQRGANYFGMSRAEFAATASFFALMIAFKIVNMIFWKFNSDEPQHMHVIWAWARGFVQYRDIFDNHMPLFQIMFAPIFGLIGDRPTILYWMRFILLPMYFVATWCTYRIGTLLFSKRTGVWAVIMTGFYPGYHFCSSEFRTDNLWAPLWLLCLTVLLGGALTVRRAMVAGLLLGFCFGVSMKTTLLLLSIFVGASAALLLPGPKKIGFFPVNLASCVAAFLASAAIIPAAIMIAFACAGIWPQFRYLVFDYNILPGVRNHPAWWIVIFPIAFPLLFYAARLIVSRAPDRALGFRRGFVFLVCGFYLSSLLSFWGLVSRQDYLPYHPLAFALGSGALLAISSRFIWPMLLPAAIAAIEFVVGVISHPLWIDSAKIETNLLRAVLTLTDPGDFVFDRKGETIFRQRCFRPVLETLTLERIRRGLLVDDVAERCIETRACVATDPPKLHSTMQRFIEENYLPIGNGLRVAGALSNGSLKDRHLFEFKVVIPAPYKIVERDVLEVRGVLDGMAYDGAARFLTPGKHNFVPKSETDTVAVVWAQAVDRGFTPFGL